MVTLLDCIKRTPSILENILQNQNSKYQRIVEVIKKEGINSIVIVGSGTSYTASVTAMPFFEEITHLYTSVILPNNFMNKTVFCKDCLYIFVSQTGTSHLTRCCLDKVKKMKMMTVAITESENTPLARQADIHICLDCGYEEYGCRTIGFSATVFNEMLMALAIGASLGTCKDIQMIEENAHRGIQNLSSIIENTIVWFHQNSDSFNEIDSYILYGAESLWGIALEGALKITEITQKFLSIGYEMDDGLHGPTLGFTKKNGIIILNDGERNIEIADGLAQFVKNEIGHAFVIGKNTIDRFDLPLDIKGKEFKCLEYAAFVQTFAYLLAKSNHVEIVPITKMQLPDSKYYNTHDEEK